MNKSELVDYIADKVSADVPKTVVSEILDLAFQGITGSLSEGGDFRWTGFGTLKVTRREATEGRNPRTGETIKIPATNRVKFTPGKELKEAVNS
ncbi:MAG: HU family DNA-binding protein [Alphaproteobacteria bacterium]|nr:HU family DNA-binding protein [Alphaproteobacteria bacterium]